MKHSFSGVIRYSFLRFSQALLIILFSSFVFYCIFFLFSTPDFVPSGNIFVQYTTWWKHALSGKIQSLETNKCIGITFLNKFIQSLSLVLLAAAVIAYSAWSYKKSRVKWHLLAIALLFIVVGFINSYARQTAFWNSQQLISLGVLLGTVAVQFLYYHYGKNHKIWGQRFALAAMYITWCFFYLIAIEILVEFSGVASAWWYSLVSDHHFANLASTFIILGIVVLSCLVDIVYYSIEKSPV